MARDSQTKLNNRRSKRQEELNKKKKQVENSDSDDNSDESESENDEMDVHEYRKFISKIFPSKYMNKKVII